MERHPGVNTASVRDLWHRRDTSRAAALLAAGPLAFSPSVPLGKGARTGPVPRPGPRRERSMAKLEDERRRPTHPVTPALDDPLAERGSGRDAAGAAPGPYDQALAAGEELRRKPYVAAGTIQTLRQHAKDRMTVWERIEVLQDPDTQPTVLYQNWGQNLDGASIVTAGHQDRRPRRGALRPRLHRPRRLDGRHQRPQARQPDLPGRRARHPAASA